ncbi:hypothetical protein GCM10023074_20630 [Microbispora amethystogenes]|uniref:PPM-type phosphatase domain-containing protein n=1 Tax=Microbispora amethystogenes TaxID=1427754 RepID=A0ABQ4FCB3_9ACTN|nr:hypothetical protein Mam01_25640 [Microbispora amethystogenes]
MRTDSGSRETRHANDDARKAAAEWMIAARMNRIYTRAEKIYEMPARIGWYSRACGVSIRPTPFATPGSSFITFPDTRMTLLVSDISGHGCGGPGGTAARPTDTVRTGR